MSYNSKRRTKTTISGTRRPCPLVKTPSNPENDIPKQRTVVIRLPVFRAQHSNYQGEKLVGDQFEATTCYNSVQYGSALKSYLKSVHYNQECPSQKLWTISNPSLLSLLRHDFYKMQIQCIGRPIRSLFANQWMLLSQNIPHWTVHFIGRHLKVKNWEWFWNCFSKHPQGLLTYKHSLWLSVPSCFTPSDCYSEGSGSLLLSSRVSEKQSDHKRSLSDEDEVQISLIDRLSATNNNGLSSELNSAEHVQLSLLNSVMKPRCQRVKTLAGTFESWMDSPSHPSTSQAALSPRVMVEEVQSVTEDLYDGDDDGSGSLLSDQQQSDPVDYNEFSARALKPPVFPRRPLGQHAHGPRSRSHTRANEPSDQWISATPTLSSVDDNECKIRVPKPRKRYGSTANLVSSASGDEPEQVDSAATPLPVTPDHEDLKMKSEQATKSGRIAQTSELNSGDKEDLSAEGSGNLDLDSARAIKVSPITYVSRAQFLVQEQFTVLIFLDEWISLSVFIIPTELNMTNFHEPLPLSPCLYTKYFFKPVSFVFHIVPPDLRCESNLISDQLIPTSNEVALVHSTESESVNELTDEPMYSEAEAAFKENSATWNAPSFSSVSLHEIPQKQSITFDDLEVTGECNAFNSTQLTSTDSGLDFNFSRGVSANNLNTQPQFDNAEKAAPDPMVRSSTRQDKENWEIIEQLYVMRDQSDRKVKELHSQLFDGPEMLAASCDHFRTFIGQLEALNFRVNSALSRWSLSSRPSNEGRKIGARDRTAQELSTVWNDTLESGGNWLRLLQEAFVNSKGLAALIAESQRHLHFAEARIRQVIDQNVRSRRAKIVKKSREGSSDSTNTSTLNEEPPEAEEFSHVPTALRLLRVIRFRLSGWFAHTNLLLMTGESTDILSILSARKHARISESGDSALGREPSTSENDIGLRMKQLRSTIGGLIDDAERLLTEWSMRDRNTQRSSSDHLFNPLYTSSSSMSSEQAHISRLPRLKENDVLGSSDTEDNIEESVSVTSRSSMSSVSDALDDVVKEQAADVSWASESTARSLPQSDNTSCGLSMTLNTYSVHSVTSGRPCKGFIQRTGQPETGSLSNMRLYDTVTSHSLTENNIDVSSMKTLVDLPLKSSETLLNTHVSATEAPNSSPVVNFSSSTSFLQKSLRKIFLPFKKLRRGFRSRPAHLDTSAELLLSSSCKPVTTDISMDHVDSLPAPRVISAGDSEDREDTNAAVRRRSNSPIANEPTNAAHKISTGRLFRPRVLFPRCCYFILGVLFALLLVLAFPPVFYYFFWLPRLENGGTGSGCLYSWLRTRSSEVGPGRTLLKSWPNNAPPF
ncbi:unnamed protein product [Calicophoron daubneyi]|uniref:KASH domain-containing protein n=1 Tax=Calicophoron daubneyi TaxID=300641 RepID=A0AAV2THA2_CALDB